MTERFTDRVAVVTGASSGNGRAIALALAREGAAVVCADVRKSAIPGGYEPDIEHDTDELIRCSGGRCTYVETDVRDAAAMSRLVDGAVRSFGRLDIFVNNAGFGRMMAITEESEQEHDLVMSVNAKGTYLGCKAAIATMLAQEPSHGVRGRIVNIASIGGMVAMAGHPSYCMSKGAVVLLTKVLAVDYAKDLINVNAICPGAIATSLTRGYFDDPEVYAGMRAAHPWPDLGTAQDIADAALFLASDQARWATGVILPVDGGLTAP